MKGEYEQFIIESYVKAKNMGTLETYTHSEIKDILGLNEKEGS